MKNTSNNIRQKFLNFFKKKQHHIISGSSLIPEEEENILFTNAGMNQFKNIYLGKKKIKKKSIISSQYCLRTGGKHNDFNNVGYTNHHHTLFEMLGNFSFGSYFKKEAITYAWELLTSSKWFNFPKEKLIITYYYKDNETYSIWSKIIKINSNNLIAIRDKNNLENNSDNFWYMGDTGPCGPSTEIFYDKGDKKSGNLPGSKKHIFGDRYIEIWNIVFIQFNKVDSKRMLKLSKPYVDTGMGLERITSIIQKKNSNYEIETFKKLINLIKKELNIKKNNNDTSLKIISDHIRSSICLISEKIYPSNEKRGYVLRKIIRRALSHGYLLGIKKPFFYKLPKHVIISMDRINEDFKIQKNIKKIEKILKNEEEQFFKILDNGMKELIKEIKKSKHKIICTKKIFYLYDTLGLPIDISKDICKKNKISININELNDEIKKNKEKNNKNKKIKNNIELSYINKKSIFVGYKIFSTSSIIIQIIKNKKNSSNIKINEKGIIILDKTPFFSESGGQSSDYGIIKTKNSIFEVKDVKKNGNYIGHIGTLISGKMFVCDSITAEINKERRLSIQSNHTSTHLLKASLKEITKKNIKQEGSFIDSKYFRFDFIYKKDISLTEIKKIEMLVNKKIQENIPIQIKTKTLKQIKNENKHLISLDKHYDKVRVIYIKNFSIELCGGTHHENTGNIGFFKIINQKKIGSNIIRIEATTGLNAIKYVQKIEERELSIVNILKIEKSEIIQNINNLKRKIQCLKKEIEENKKIESMRISKKLILKSIYKKNIYLLLEVINKRKETSLRDIIYFIKQKISRFIILIIEIRKNKQKFIISVDNKIFNFITSLDIKNKLFLLTSGKGGGNKSIIEGILSKESYSYDLIKKIKEWIEKKINF